MENSQHSFLKKASADIETSSFFQKRVRKSIYYSIVYNLYSVNVICMYRYCKLLVQEFAVKVDQGFLIAVLSMFEMTSVDEESHRLVAFQRDCEVIDCSLMDDMVYTTAGTAKNFYDMLHFSPLKVAIYCSLLYTVFQKNNCATFIS